MGVLTEDDRNRDTDPVFDPTGFPIGWRLRLKMHFDDGGRRGRWEVVNPDGEVRAVEKTQFEALERARQLAAGDAAQAKGTGGGGQTGPNGGTPQMPQGWSIEPVPEKAAWAVYGADGAFRGSRRTAEEAAQLAAKLAEEDLYIDPGEKAEHVPNGTD